MNYNDKQKLAQIKNHKKSLLDGKEDISLTNILNSEACQKIISECREFRHRVYTPLKTLFTFIKQVLSADKSCKKAVAGVVVEQLSTGDKEVSSNTGPYCKARKRLPETAVHELVKEVGKSASKKASIGWKPYGRELKAFDGSTLLMSDTKENQGVYPQHSNQKKGLDFLLLD
jgi:hypothetical protein